ncbi:hypothetical protein ACRAWF_34965 [Streptomyces sp. L7]
MKGSRPLSPRPSSHGPESAFLRQSHDSPALRLAGRCSRYVRLTGPQARRQPRIARHLERATPPCAAPPIPGPASGKQVPGRCSSTTSARSAGPRLRQRRQHRPLRGKAAPRAH